MVSGKYSSFKTQIVLMNKLMKCVTEYATVIILANSGLLDTQSSQAKEPSYNNKPLSEWICCGSPDDQEQAFLHIGTNSLPIVLDLIGASDKNMKWVAMRLESRELREKAISGDEGVVNAIRESASKAFEILGTNAESAVPQLVRILNENDQVTSIYAADSLGRVGSKGFIALTNALTTGKTNTRVAIVGELAQGGFNSEVVTPLLIGLLKDRLPDVRRLAAEGLGGRDPDVVIPLLIQVLDDTDMNVKATAATSLSSYGAKAIAALPKIVSAYTNSINEGLPLTTYRDFSDALKRIDLETAKTTEAFIINNPINPYRQYYTKTELKNGLELIAGGYIQSQLLFLTNHYLSSAQLYDPKTGKWESTGEMTTPRYNHAAALLLSGKVLVAGGADGVNALATAELYDPLTGKWTKTGSLKKPMGGQIILQSDGKALFVNGIDYPRRPPFDKELYDPVSGTWDDITSK